MKDLLKDFPVKTEIKVEWRDMNVAQHVHNVRYLDWVESGRIAYFEALNFDAVPEKGIGNVIGYVDCKYITSVVYPDTIIAATRVIDIQQFHIILETHLFSKSQNRLVAISNQKVVFFDFDNQSKAEIPPSFLEKMKPLIL